MWLFRNGQPRTIYLEAAPLTTPSVAIKFGNSGSVFAGKLRGNPDYPKCLPEFRRLFGMVDLLSCGFFCGGRGILLLFDQWCWKRFGKERVCLGLFECKVNSHENVCFYIYIYFFLYFVCV